MKNLIFIVLGLSTCASILLIQSLGFELLQNKPVAKGELVTFTIEKDSSIEEIPFIAWDFGDGTGLGRYRKSLTATHRYSATGVYQVFARIQGENIPLSVTQTVYTPSTNPLPTRSSTIAIDTLRNVVWVVNADNNSVSCIDAIQNQLIREIPVGKHPRTVAIDASGNAWVACEDDAVITVVSQSGDLINKLSLPHASRPYGICFDPQLEHCYVTLQGTGELVKIATSSSEKLAYAYVGRAPRGIAIPSDGLSIYVTQFISPENNGYVREINASTMQVAKEIELAFDNTPDFEDRGRGVPNYISSLTISPDGTQAWVPSKKDNVARGQFRDGQALTFDNTVRSQVTRIDMSTGEELIAMRTDINDADLPCAVEFSPYGNMAFVALQGNNKIQMIDVKTNARLGLLEPTGLAPQGLVLNADGTRLYVHNFMSRTVKVFNTEDIILGNNYASKVAATINTVTSELLDAQVLLGKQIFYNAEDRRMTFAGYISCATCHLDGGSDERVWDFTDRGEGLRNTHSLLGRAGTGIGNVHWTANFDEIQDFENDIRNSFAGSGFLPDSIFNSGTVSDPLGDKKAGLSPELDALAAYVNSLSEVHPSPYRKADGNLTSEGILGKEIFIQAGCASCHSGSNFSDRATGLLHDVGTITSASGKRRSEVLGGFGTPTLKGIWETAPYLHDGSAPTLYDVLITKNTENKHDDLSTFTESEIDQLIAFLLQIDESDDAIITGVSNKASNTSSSEIRVLPNPAVEKIVIHLNKKSLHAENLIIRSIADGKIIATIPIVNQSEITVDVSSYKSGVYFVSYSNSSSQAAKFIVL